MKKLVAILLVVLMLFSFFQGALRENVVKAGDQPIWPMLQYNAQRTGQCPYDTSKNTGVLKWKQLVFWPRFLAVSAVAIASDGTIYAGSDYFYYFYALNSDGTIKWKFKVDSWLVSFPTIGPDGTIYVLTHITDYLYAYYPDGSGKLKWKFKLGDNGAQSPIIGLDGTIYIGSYDSYFYAINPDGTLKWKFKADNKIRAPATIAPDGTIYVSSSGNYLYAINPDGALKWTFETPTKDTGAPISVAVASDGTIYAAGRGKILYALNPNGMIKWTFETGEWLVSSPAVSSDGTIYIGSAASYIATDPPIQDSYLYAINPDGTLKWKFKVDNAIVIASPVIAAEGTVYIGSRDGYLYAINPDGTLKWKFKTGGMIHSTPAIDDKGTVYIGSDDGYLYAIGNYTITSSVGIGGSISPSGNIPVNSGNSQTFTVTPNPGYYIKDVKVDDKSIGPVTTYTFENTTSDHTIEAQFEINTYSITASTSEGGSISPSGNITLNYGTNQTFTITPNPGYYIKDVKVDDKSVGAVSSYTLTNINSDHTIEAIFEKKTVIILQIGKTSFIVNSTFRNLDSPPVIKNERTLLPIRAVIEALNGTVDWNATEKKVTVSLGLTTIELWIGKPTAKVNGSDTLIDVTNNKVFPEIINSRTMLPLRFVTENLGCDVQWDGPTQTITIIYSG